MTTKVDIVTGLTDVSAQDASIGLFKTSRTEASLQPEQASSDYFMAPALSLQDGQIE